MGSTVRERSLEFLLGFYTLLVHRNVCKYMHTSEHAYADNLVVEYRHSTHKKQSVTVCIKQSTCPMFPFIYNCSSFKQTSYIIGVKAYKRAV